MNESPHDIPAPVSVGKANRKKEASARRIESRPEPLGKSATPLAAQRAAAILDVLAGQRSTTEAAAALEISVNHYYLLERRALEGLMAACEPQVKGPKGPTLETQLQRLEQQLQQCRRECMRQAALVRATQRAVGLQPAEVKKPRRKNKTSGPSRKKRRPTVRALKAAQRLRENSSGSKSATHLKPSDMNLDAPSSPIPDQERNDGNSG
jgi:transposase